MLTRRNLLVATAGGLLGGCGGDPATPEGNQPLLPRRPVVPVNGPAWTGFAGNAQHSALGQVATLPMRGFYWYTPVDQNPQYANGALQTHYGSPLITRRNTVLVPVKVGSSFNFYVYGRVGATGDLLWRLFSDYVAPPARWIPSFNPVLTPDNRMVMPIIGGRVQIRADADAETSSTENIAFYGNSAYALAPGLFNGSVFINTPLTSDSAGNVFFGFQVLQVVSGGPAAGGIARIPADGSAPTYRTGPAITGVAALDKPQTNCAPALSLDGNTLYVVFNNSLPAADRPFGRLVALDATTLALRAQVDLIDPASGALGWVSNDATSSPVVGPDGDVFIGVLESDAPNHNYRGWLLHFNAALTQTKTPGSFGWDNTPSIVPAAMLGARYTGSSSYLLLTKYNNYFGVGSGDGRNMMAILDPNATQADPVKPAISVMREVITILGPTPDPGRPAGAVREWCVNTAAVDPLTNSVLINNEDGVLYRWDLANHRLSESLKMNAGVFQSYTPTAIGPDGSIYAINNAILHCVGQ